MKKILPTLLAIALIGIAEFANAQEFNFGLKAGANFANLSGDDADGDGITSYHAGALGRFTFTVIGAQVDSTDKFTLIFQILKRESKSLKFTFAH